MNRALLWVSVALLLASCGGTNTASRRTTRPLGSFQLRLSDVPAGFYLAHASRLSADKTAQNQGLDAALYVGHGGGGSLTELFLLRQPATEGLTAIVSQVIVFGSAGNARWGFQQIRNALARSGTIGTVQVPVNISATPTPLPATIKTRVHPVGPPPTTYQPERAPLLGDQDAGFRNTSAAYAGEYVFDNQVVLFRRGGYCGFVHISGNFGQVRLSEALALAHRIDNRIRGR